MQKHGSFWIKKTALDALLEQGASAETICVYLTLARFTGRDNCYSTAGITGIYNRYSLAKKVISEKLEQLAVRNFIMTYDSFLNVRSNYDEIQPLPKRKVHYCINHSIDDLFGIDRIWFNNSIIGNKPEDGTALSKVFMYEEPSHAARLLLLLHSHYDNDKYVSDPFVTAYSELINYFKTIIDNVSIFTGELSDGFIFSDLAICKTLKMHDSDLQQSDRAALLVKMNKALKHLYNCGLVDYVISVVKTQDISQPLYQLDVKKGDNASRENEVRYCFQIEEALRAVGVRTARGDKRLQFRTKYAGILPDSVDGNLICHLRPRHVVTNPANTPAKLAQIKQSKPQEMLKNLTSILKMS